MKASELRDLTAEELKAEHLRLLKSQMNLRIKRSMEQMAQPHMMKAIRRDIARVQTIMRENRNG
ncbi:MAG: 50S ribosomal protein L29 [Gammaproteobacteria bacterium]|nr:50S ribosomal protein L29 [Gammaproteobacteria bacterium]